MRDHPRRRAAALAVGCTMTVGAMFGGGTAANAAVPSAQLAPIVASSVMETKSAARGLERTEIKLASARAANNNWAAKTAQFAGCLGGFGFVAVPIVTGFMFGGPGGAISAAKAWIPRLGPVGATVAKWCMSSVLGVRM